jgi:hypothetical protein
MNLLNLLMGTMNTEPSVDSLSQKTGVSSGLLKKLLPLAIPLLLKALTNNAASSGAGAQSLLTALGQHTQNKAIPEQISEADEEDGGKIIAHILGDDAEATVQRLSAETGMTADEVNRSLSGIAPSLMSALSAATNTASAAPAGNGFDLTELMGMFGGVQQEPAQTVQPLQQQAQKPQGGGLLGSLFGGGGLLGSLFGGGQQQAAAPDPAEDDAMNGGQLLSILTSLLK